MTLLRAASVNEDAQRLRARREVGSAAGNATSKSSASSSHREEEVLTDPEKVVVMGRSGKLSQCPSEQSYSRRNLAFVLHAIIRFHWHSTADGVRGC